MKPSLIIPSLSLLFFLSCSFIDEQKIEKTDSIPIYSFLESKEIPIKEAGTGEILMQKEKESAATPLIKKDQENDFSSGTTESWSGETIDSSDMDISDSTEDSALGTSDEDVEALVDALFEAANK